jgi:hypothetical protein
MKTKGITLNALSYHSPYSIRPFPFSFIFGFFRFNGVRSKA